MGSVYGEITGVLAVTADTDGKDVVKAVNGIDCSLLEVEVAFAKLSTTE